MIRTAIFALALIMAIGVIGTATFTQSATSVFAQDTGTQGQQGQKKEGPKTNTNTSESRRLRILFTGHVPPS
jgi:hypothetical protein